MKVADYILKALEEEGLEHIFCFPGGGCLFLIDAINRTSIKPIFNLHEQACAICAEGYAQTTGNFGALLVTTGPGVLNAMTGVAAAYMDSVPLIVLSGQVPTSQSARNSRLRQRGVQEVPTEDLVKSIVKEYYYISLPEDTCDIVEGAIRLATTGRPGPVWIDVPLDIQQQDIEPSLPAYMPSHQYVETRSKLSCIINLMYEAKRPVFLVGNGVRNHTDLLNNVLDIYKAPVLTTWRALDLFTEDDPLYCGRPGIIAERGANWTLQESDLLICLGARLDFCQTGFNQNNFAPNATKVIVDIDKAEIDKLDFCDALGMNMHTAGFLYKLHNMLTVERRPQITFSGWLHKCKKWKVDYPLKDSEGQTGALLYDFFDKLSRELTKDDVVVLGSSGSVSEVGQQAIKIFNKGTRVFCSPGLGSMGFGLPEAIGAAIAGAKRVICVEGDGSFAMNMHELQLVKDMNLPIKFFILNNSGYLSIVNSQNNLCDGRLLGVNEGTGLHLPNYRNVAVCFGLRYFGTRDTNCVNFVLKQPESIICELYGSKTHQTQPRTKTVKNQDGTLTSSTLENLWPFIERKENE